MAQFTTTTIRALSLGNVSITGINTTPELTQFRGLKFASIKERYDYPTRIDNYDLDIDATEYGPIPPQPIVPLNGVIPADQLPPPQPKQDEFECLNLNILRPTSVRKPLPVLLWIFPGGNINGSASSKVFDATALVERSIKQDQPVIFVNISYRLSLFGFLYVNGRANHAMYDQLAGIEWVKKHIADFGGDPENITLIGESAGSLATHYHSISQTSEGLFRRIACLSTVIESRSPLPLNDAKALVEKAKNILGVTTDEELKTVPAEELIKAVPLIGGMYGPVNDGGWLGEGPFIDRLPLAQVESVAVGNCRREVFSFAPRIRLTSNDKLYEKISTVPEVGSSLVKLYDIEPTDSESNFEHSLDLYDDLSYGQPVHHLVASLRKAGIPTYHYLFDQPNPFNESLDSHHGVDVLYFFNWFKFDSKYDDFVDKYQSGWIRYANGLPPWDFLSDTSVQNVVFSNNDVHVRQEGEYEARRNVKLFEKLDGLRGKYDAYNITKRFLSS
ncbi:Alpha/Beta hydrolase protein [Lipomyces japonicus]|uniref:Alpha/Beta hydrolase protein n=1 Tax=Lipomyces japonicus TaxID=56871 RepID=UPI0034CF169E